MATDIQGIIDTWGPGEQVLLMLRSSDPEGKRRLIRGKAATLLHFGLNALDSVPTAFERRGTFHIGTYQYGGPSTSWRTVKVVVPELWPSGSQFRAWGFSVNAPWNNSDLLELGEHITRAGVEWRGFYDRRNSWILKLPLGVRKQAA